MVRVCINKIVNKVTIRRTVPANFHFNENHVSILQLKDSKTLSSRQVFHLGEARRLKTLRVTFVKFKKNHRVPSRSFENLD